MDNSSSVDKPVFNRVVALKEDKEAQAAKAANGGALPLKSWTQLFLKACF